jgi:hypothetical protein
MSAIASFYLLDKSKLDELIQNAEIIVKKSLFRKSEIDNYWDYLANHAKALKDFHASGYIIGNVLVYLQEEKGINLLQNEYDDIARELIEKRGSSHILLTHKQKADFVSRLNASNFTLAELQKFNEDFSEEGDEETAIYSLEAIQVLQDNLSEVQNDNQILLLIIG